VRAIEFSSDIGKTLTETFKMMYTTAQHDYLACALVLNDTSGSDGRCSLVGDKDRGQKQRIESDAIMSIRDALDIDLSALNSNYGVCGYMDCLHDIDVC